MALEQTMIEIERLRKEEILPAREKLEHIYENSESSKARCEAGKALGYSKLRRFFHEQPALGIILGLVAAREAIGGIVYLSCLLGEYLKK